MDCSQSPAAVLTVVSGGTALKLRTPDYKALPLIGAQEFSCTWNNRSVYTSGWTFERQFPTNFALAARIARDPFSPPPLIGATQTDDRAGQLQRLLAENENENLLRLVGYVEYTYALSRLDQVLRGASDAELAIMDQWVKEQDPFVVYVNLSRKFPQVATTAFGEWIVERIR